MRHDKQKALDVIEFIQMLKHTGDFYGVPFVLLDWQHEALWDIYGTVNAEGYRQYRYAYLEIPKKNGKTELAAALSVYHLVCDGPSGQIYCCAADREQASLVYRAAKEMIEQEPEFEGMLKIVDSKREIHNVATGTFIKVLSAEAFTKHGINPTVVIFDELHAQPNRALWDVMTFGAGSARKEPLWWVITTAGDDPDRHSIGWEQHEYARKVIDGEIEDPSWRGWIFGAKEEDDIFDEKTWFKANPSLGHTIELDAVRREAIGAKNSESQEKLFRWLRLNQWISLKSTGWLPLTLWDSTAGDWGRESLVGKRCYIGLDLSSTIDLTAAAFLFPPQDGINNWRVVFEGWIPEDNMKERIDRDKVPFDQWVRKGFIYATPGSMVDYSFVEARIKTLAKIYQVEYLCTDPWNSRMLQQRLEKSGIESLEVSQSIAGLSPGMKEMERLLRSGELTHEENPAARWCFGNVAVHIDGNENMKPMKNKSADRIDLIVAWINAMNIAIRLEEETSVYEERGILIL